MTTQKYDSMPTSIPEGVEYVMIKDSDSSSKDLSVLSGVREEVVLEGFESISDLTPLANCDSVIFINCRSDLQVYPSLERVEKLQFNNCPRVSGISQLTSLKHLTLHNMKRSIGNTITLPNLETVFVSNTDVCFNNCPKLTFYSSKCSEKPEGDADSECKAFSAMNRYCSNGAY